MGQMFWRSHIICLMLGQRQYTLGDVKLLEKRPGRAPAFPVISRKLVWGDGFYGVWF